MTAVLPAILATHRPSHSGLIWQPSPPSRGDTLHAIIVPTIRHAKVLEHAFTLGMQLGTPVLVLCSKWSRVQEVRGRAEAMGADVIAADVNCGAWLPILETADMHNQKKLSDLSLKRNIGLAVARMVGWDRVLFLDDDIIDVNPSHIRAAASLLGSHDVVGLKNVGFHDNSVVCHALRRVERSLGMKQDTFVGGGAMAVAVDRVDAFFPNVYNEDWFFMLGVLERQHASKQIAATGTMAQTPYDPFIDPFRARYEEFGDCLGEGLFALLDDGHPVSAALDADYWRAFLADRAQLLERILAATLAGRATEERGHVVECLKAAQARHQIITAEGCLKYLSAWYADRATWAAFVNNVGVVASPRIALEKLGIRS